MLYAARSPGPVAVITIDRLPAWMLPAFGCAWVAMPHLDALAGRGVVLDRVLATSDDGYSTLAALAGGRLPRLALVSEHRFPTAIVTDDATFAAAAQEPSDVSLVKAVDATAPALSEADTNLGRLFAAAATTVAGGQHRLIWCHASSLGTCWDAPPGFRDRYIDPEDPPPPSGTMVPAMDVGPDTDPDTLVGLRHVFAGQLTLLDHCLGTLLEAVAKRPEPWTILVAGTRGLGLGLHDIVGCAPMLPFSEVMQLPAILVDHRERMAGQRYGGLLTPDDLGVTLLDMIGCPQARSTDPRHGRTLTGLLDRWQGPDRDRVIARAARGTAVITPAWHLVHPAEGAAVASRAKLFAKPDDFFETCDVADRCPAVAEELDSLAEGAPEQAWRTTLSNEALSGL